MSAFCQNFPSEYHYPLFHLFNFWHALHLQSVPIHVLEDYNMTSMTLEYRRECRQSNLLESLTSTTASVTEDSNNNNKNKNSHNHNSSNNRKADLEYTHLLRMQADKAEIIRARSEWQSKDEH